MAWVLKTALGCKDPKFLIQVFTEIQKKIERADKLTRGCGGQ